MCRALLPCWSTICRKGGTLLCWSRVRLRCFGETRAICSKKKSSLNGFAHTPSSPLSTLRGFSTKRAEADKTYSTFIAHQLEGGSSITHTANRKQLDAPSRPKQSCTLSALT